MGQVGEARYELMRDSKIYSRCLVASFLQFYIILCPQKVLRDIDIGIQTPRCQPCAQTSELVGAAEAPLTAYRRQVQKVQP